ncbi:MAG: metal-dependent hydrolase [Paenibacillus sp.]|nr:metal-dependent hydrolase [Paenibacillus sp.]
MTGRTHLIVGTGVTLSVLSIIGQPVTLPGVAVAAVSSLLPDIDEPNSLLMQKTMPKSVLNKIKLALVAAGLGFILYCYLQSFFVPYSYGIGGLMIAACLIHQRLFRQLLMIITGGLMLYIGGSAGPWWASIGALLMVCAVLPHRGLTHSLYGIFIWGGVLYFASVRLQMPLWIPGILAYTLHLLCDVLTKHGIQPLPPLKWKCRIPLMSTGKFSGFFVESICITLTFVLFWNAFVEPIGDTVITYFDRIKAKVSDILNASQ